MKTTISAGISGAGAGIKHRALEEHHTRRHGDGCEWNLSHVTAAQVGERVTVTLLHLPE